MGPNSQQRWGQSEAKATTQRKGEASWTKIIAERMIFPSLKATFFFFYIEKSMFVQEIDVNNSQGGYSKESLFDGFNCCQIFMPFP